MYSSPNSIRTVKSRVMRWARHVARVGEMTHAYKLIVARQHMQDQGTEQY